MNTTAMIQNCKSGDAGQLARSYQGGGMTDWSLPSQGELVALLVYPNLSAIGGIANSKYVSSTQYGAQKSTYISFDENFGYSPQQTSQKGVSHGLRPVRAF